MGPLASSLLAALPLLAQSTLTRPHDPVVMTGAQLGAQANALSLSDVVAFRYDGTWVQIPLQIDERAVVAFDDIYGPGLNLGSALTVLTYTDPNTHTGADPNPLFDNDDELVFMAADAGARAPAGTAEPDGVTAGSGVELALSDPLDGGSGYVYLFVQTGGLDPAAGEDRVDYTFNLLAGSYLGAYNTAIGPNPEASVVTTSNYEQLFIDRWVREDMSLFASGPAGTANGDDILDRQKFLFQPGQCSRTEETFSAEQGAFLANIDGPLRGIRSLMGANSGPLSQRDHFFYAGREDDVSYVRVHALPMAGMDVLDFSLLSSGMVHANEHYPAGVVVDGSPDTVSNLGPKWEVTTGLQGTLSVAHWVETDLSSIDVVGYYEDDFTPSLTQCTGDPYEYGMSGPWVTSPIPNTDPMLGPANQLTLHRTHHYEAPAASVASAVAVAAQRAAQAQTPLVVTVGGNLSLVASYCTAGVSASGCRASLSASGTASASASSGFSVSAVDVEGQKDGLFYYGTSGAQANPWGNGSSYQCVIPPVRRAGILQGQGSPAACDGGFTQDLNAYWTTVPHKRPTAGQTVNLQLWYRDPLQSSNQTTSLSDALEFSTAP